jgi:hypothetical protein
MARRHALIVTALAALTVIAVLVLHHFHRSKLQKQDPIAEKLSRIQVPRPELERPCGDLDSKRVFLVIGQSNAANHGETPGSSEHGLVWFGGKCYSLVDPLPGGTGRGGSIWTRFADIWFARTGESTLFVVLAVDATTVGEWASHPKLAARLENLLISLRDHTVELDAVLWQQGEADARLGTDQLGYTLSAKKLVEKLRQITPAQPIIKALSTRCRSNPNDVVRASIMALSQERLEIHLGPDTDTIKPDARHDDCHFSERGLNIAADLWASRVLYLTRGLDSRDGACRHGTPKS